MIISNIRVLGDRVEFWETFDDHIEIVEANYEQFEWVTGKTVGSQKLRELNRATEFKKRYKELKENVGYRVEMTAPIIHKMSNDMVTLIPRKADEPIKRNWDNPRSELEDIETQLIIDEIKRKNNGNDRPKN